MLTFIICDDEETIRKRISKIISKLMMPTDFEYKTYKFNSYGKEFEQVVNNPSGNKIYILDIEVNNKSGLDMARRIREKDWKSIIVILTAHYELAFEAFKARLMLLDFISKFDNYEENLYKALQLALKATNCKQKLTFECNRVSYCVDLDDILYVVKDECERKIKIKTFYTEYVVSMALCEVIAKLDTRFCRTHRACIVNKENIESVNYKENKIIFKNGETTNLLSRNYKKEVKMFVFN